MRKIWPGDDNCSEDLLKDLILDVDKIGKGAYEYFLAFHSDRFIAGKYIEKALEGIDWTSLLEIRLFSAEQEMLARRTMSGKNNLFQWRVASEAGLSSTDYVSRIQTLDIDSSYTQRGDNGNLQLMTTGGGKYELPIEEGMDSIKIISYIDYDAEGMAYFYDNRYAGFKRGGE